MRLRDKIRTAARVAHWRLTWSRRDLDHRPGGTLDERFASAREAVRRIPDGACGLSTGMAGNGRCSLLFQALRDRFEREGRPHGLTWIAVGGQGGRGKAPGTVEELGQAGLLARFVAGHVETTRAQLALAEAGRLELHVLPQGEMVASLAAQATGGGEVRSTTGIGTFLDPRTGPGSPVSAGAREQFVRVDGERLAYRLPPVDLAFIAAPLADREGNVYFDGAAVITENLEAARAAKANGGLVLVVVGAIVAPQPERIRLPRELVDAVIVDRYAEQTVLAPQTRPWRALAPGGDGHDEEAIERLRFINRLLRLTPVRGAAELALGRLGADQFARALTPPAGAKLCVNIGVGFGEEVCRELFASPLRDTITFTSETGVFGGMPAPGIYFGAAVNPERIESSAWMFRHYAEHLDAAVLGFLEVDTNGNVNVSRRGPRMTDCVGPGGLPSITNAARNVFFVGTFLQGARWRVSGEALTLEGPGEPKFVPAVREITFNGQRALDAGKRVWYVTHVGTFRLTREGLQVERLMPGIDLERDVLRHSGARIVVPPGPLPRAPRPVLTGDGFTLAWGRGTGPDDGKEAP